MKIGEAADASGVSAKMIRYYESIGLIDAPPRSASGYRHYREDDIHMLLFIRRGRELGFSMAQLRTLTSLWRDKSRASADVKRLANAHIETLNERIASLQAMADTLKTLARQCHGDARPDCPILDAFAAHNGQK
ncbi:Cu(I)-responsive transcriptional regulator [Alcanivorax sp. JB21]|uniref:Cu(I)-responsive transcriptional regulator n=1 Tax=Alcanivorax limicola TaxID=2874102 RepID=UPI001CBC00C6|nr:Cu(I)-responsive transcriptional regulator [Alcanivorax limicola]MBZ2189328.1 Cu(I)-responsive transcriptional regulator [Alcanivorax limicola]